MESTVASYQNSLVLLFTRRIKHSNAAFGEAKSPEDFNLIEHAIFADYCDLRNLVGQSLAELFVYGVLDAKSL